MISNKTEVVLQERFIREVCERRADVSIFLISGVKLQGYITDFDLFSILLEGKSRQLIYKHAISTIVIDSPIV